MEKDKGILLESGTGEVEILKFVVKKNIYAINVIKVREIFKMEKDSIEAVPSSSEFVLGMTNVRGEVVTIINLNHYLSAKKGGSEEDKKPGDLMFLTEFNQAKILFTVDHVIGIDRITWADIDEPSGLMGNLVNGIIKKDGKLITFLDFEKVLGDVKPELEFDLEKAEIDESRKEEREDKRILLADDSPTIREMLKKILNKAGYTNIKIFRDGKDLLDSLLAIKEKYNDDTILNHVDGIITDIEMPKLDGHAVIKRLRQEHYFRDIPAMIFSSLITENLRHKGEAVGADEQVSKPEITGLVEKLDKLVLD